MGASSIAVIDRAVGICQNNCHGKIEVEWVGVQIHLVDVRDADANVVSGDFSKLLRRTDDLPVEQSAIDSGLAPKDDKHREIARSCEGACLVQVVQPGKLIRGSGIHDGGDC